MIRYGARRRENRAAANDNNPRNLIRCIILLLFVKFRLDLAHDHTIQREMTEDRWLESSSLHGRPRSARFTGHMPSRGTEQGLAHATNRDGPAFRKSLRSTSFVVLGPIQFSRRAYEVAFIIFVLRHLTSMAAQLSIESRYRGNRYSVQTCAAFP